MKKLQQHYDAYTPEHQEVWQRLFRRQADNLSGKSEPGFLHALDAMRDVLHGDAIPMISRINEALYRRSGWSVAIVPGLIPVNDFFALLAARRFCASTWLRSLPQLDYLEEPDMFHDIFGHLPLLWDPTYAGFMQAIGRLGVAYAACPDAVAMLERFYWFTIEFGLSATTAQPLIYGAGIMSSYGETNSIFSGAADIRPFRLDDILHHPFVKETLQNQYFCVPGLDTLYNILPALEQALAAAATRSCQRVLPTFAAH